MLQPALRVQNEVVADSFGLPVEYWSLRACLREAQEIELTEINVAIPESLTTQKAELEATLAEIDRAEEKLAVQRKDIQTALNTIASGIAVLSGHPLPTNKPAVGAVRKPMSPEAKKHIAEGLRKAREAKAEAMQQAVEPATAAKEPTTEPERELSPAKHRELRAPRKPVRIK